MITDIKDLTSFKWATVIANSPLSIKLDGDTAALGLVPDCLVNPLSLVAGDRVRVELTERKVIVHGKSAGVGLHLSQTVLFTSSGTFSKASYPGAKAFRVRLVGGGGGGGGAGTAAAGQNSQGSGGGGGGYAEKLITDIAGLASSVTVTVGAGGAGGSGAADGADGSASSFGALVAANGGTRGFNKASSTLGGYLPAGTGGEGTAGDLLIGGSGGGSGTGAATLSSGGHGGSSQLGGGGNAVGTGAGSGRIGGAPGKNYGGGGGGAMTNAGGAAIGGGAGAPGIVIVEVYR